MINVRQLHLLTYLLILSNINSLQSVVRTLQQANFLQCFDTVGWVTDRNGIRPLKHAPALSNSQMFFLGDCLGDRL